MAKLKKKTKQTLTQDGLRFRSKKDLDLYLKLKALQEEGKIKSFRVPSVPEGEEEEPKDTFYAIDQYTFRKISETDFYFFLIEQQDKGLIEEFQLVQRNKESKYKAKKCIIDGHEFDSYIEAKFFIYLRERLLKGEIINIRLHPKYVLQEKFEKNGRTVRPITYISDFEVHYRNGKVVVYDVKGNETDDFKIKKKLFDYKYRDMELICVNYSKKQQCWIDIHTDKPID